MPPAVDRPLPATRPQQAISCGDASPSVLPACDHRAGNERILRKALAGQAQPDPAIHVCAGGGDRAPVGGERQHAQTVDAETASVASRLGRAGICIGNMSHRRWRKDLEVILPVAGTRIADTTLPKGCGVAAADAMAARLDACAPHGQQIPLHELIDLPRRAARGRIDRRPPAGAVVPRADPARSQLFGPA